MKSIKFISHTNTASTYKVGRQYVTITQNSTDRKGNKFKIVSIGGKKRITESFRINKELCVGGQFTIHGILSKIAKR